MHDSKEFILIYYLIADKVKKKKDSVNIRFTFNNDATDGDVEALSETKKTFTQGNAINKLAHVITVRNWKFMTDCKQTFKNIIQWNLL